MSRTTEIERLSALLSRVQMRSRAPRDTLHAFQTSHDAPKRIELDEIAPLQPIAGELATPFDEDSTDMPEITVEEAVIDAVLLRQEVGQSATSSTERASSPRIGFDLRGIDVDVEMDPFQEPAIELQRSVEAAGGGMSSRERMVAAEPLGDDTESSDLSESAEMQVRTEDIMSISPRVRDDETVLSRPSQDGGAAPPESGEDRAPASSRRPIVEPGTRLEQIAFGETAPGRSNHIVPPESGRHRSAEEVYDADSTGVRPAALGELSRDEFVSEEDLGVHSLAATGERPSEASRELDLPPAIAPGEFTRDLPRPGSTLPPPFSRPIPDDSTLPHAYGLRLPDVAPVFPSPADGNETTLPLPMPIMRESYRASLPRQVSVAAVVARVPFSPETLGDLLDATLSL